MIKLSTMRTSFGYLAVIAFLATPFLFWLEYNLIKTSSSNPSSQLSQLTDTSVSTDGQRSSDIATASSSDPTLSVKAQSDANPTNRVAALPHTTIQAPTAETQTPLPQATPTLDNPIALDTSPTTAPDQTSTPAPAPVAATTAPHTQDDGFNIANHLISLMTSLVSLMGFFGTTLMQWKRDQRKARSEELDNQLKELELAERLRKFQEEKTSTEETA